MKLFKKDPPAACPKCGKADGWGLLPFEPLRPDEAEENYTTPFSYAPVSTVRISKGSDGKAVKLRYHCSNCGYEKAY